MEINKEIHRNDEMRALREELLNNKVYQNQDISNPLLRFADLDIYSKDTSFFSRLTKSIRKSVLDKEIILTAEQEKCLNLLNKENLFISAPTSFGKTYIALEHIARNINKLNNIVFVVPTIALMSELRRKCFRFFGNEYSLITSDAELEQCYNDLKKIIIVVPERISTKLFQRYFSENNADFLVYDEIYKLNADPSSMKKGNNARLIRMNYIYRYLIERSNKILLLGPFIKDVDFSRSNKKMEKFITNLNLVYNDIKFDPNFTNFFGSNDDKRFVYFKSPNSINKFLKIIKESDFPKLNIDNETISWIEKNIHPDWYYVKYLKLGIGIHHGKTPMFLRKYIENEYATGEVHTILCTSTLIEGINTPTKSLVIYDKPRTVFQFNNLVGRVGRLNVNNPQKGIVYISDPEILKMSQEEGWISLNILYEDEKILTTDEEDESLYLGKEPNCTTDLNISRLSEELLVHHIVYDEVIESGIEFALLEKFIKNFNTITTYSKEFLVIRDIKSKLLKETIFMEGLQIKNYSFKVDEEYLCFDPVYQMLISPNGLKSVIEKFTSKYLEYSIEDINFFIDTLFEIDKYIKFQMSKLISLFELFDAKSCFDKQKNRAFIQTVNMIKNYSNSIDGYERILTDLGFPREDLILVSNVIMDFIDIAGTEKKLIKLNQHDVFKQLSPFGKKIVMELK